MWWGDVQQQMELNKNEIERKSRHAWMWAGDGRKPDWFSRLLMAAWNRKRKGNKFQQTNGPLI